MSVLIDVILALILAICAFIGYKHGLIRALSRFISYLIAFTVANKFYTLFAGLLLKLPFLESMLQEEPFTVSMTFLDRFTMLVDTIKENLLVFGSQSEMETASLATDHAVSVLIASTAAFLLTFVLAVLLMKLVIFLLDGIISKTPVLGQVNGIFGGIFGLFNGFFWTWLITSTFVRFLLPTLTEKFPSVFTSAIGSSIIVQICTKINPITYVIWLINFIFH